MNEHNKNIIATHVNQILRYTWLGSRLPKKKPPFQLRNIEALEKDSKAVIDLYVHGRINTFVRVNGVKKNTKVPSRILTSVDGSGSPYFLEFTELSLSTRKYIHKACLLEAQSLDMLRVVETVMDYGVTTKTFISMFPALEQYIEEHCMPRRDKKLRDFEPSELLQLQIQEVNAMLTEAVLLAYTDLDAHGRNWNIFL